MNNRIAEIVARHPGMSTASKRRSRNLNQGRYANGRVPYLEPILREAESFFSPSEENSLGTLIQTDSSFHKHLALEIARKKRITARTKAFARSLAEQAEEGLSPGQVTALFNTFNATRHRGTR